MKESKQQEKPGAKAPVWQKSRHANLVRYAASGIFYARFRIQGKLTWKCLDTSTETIAKSKLDALLRNARKTAQGPKRLAEGKYLVSDCLKAYRDSGFRPANPKRPKDAMVLKPAAVAYYEQRIEALQKTWPELFQMEAKRVTKDDIDRRWVSEARVTMSASAFNHTLGVLKNLLDYAVKAGARYDNPTKDILRESEADAEVTVLKPHQFEALLAELEAGSGPKGKACADLVRFLAFGGFRKTEAAFITWADCDFERRSITVRGHPVTGLKNRKPGEIKTIPMVPAMFELLARLKSEQPEDGPDDSVMKVRECQKSVDRASKKLGIPRLTHHGFRHLFATRCIESGVDIPTVAKFLGHKDGGALLMKTYAHILDEHAGRMAAKVNFAPISEPNIVLLPTQAASK